MPSILLVDDNLTNLKLVARVLGSEGYQVFQAAGAEQAREFIAQQLPDLILTDIDMPGMGGLALTSLLKSDETTKHIPVVALTSSAMKGDRERAFEAGCDGYIAQPVSIGALRAQVQSFIGPGKLDTEDETP